MKKIFVLLLVTLTFLTGCSVKEVNNENINEMVDTILDKKMGLYNQHSSGYKYYLPRGMSLIDSTNYNEKMFSNGNSYYLYIDVVSYHFQKDSAYKKNIKAYFSKNLTYNNKKGYIEITKIKDLYFVEMMFNYAKIEAFVPKDDINQAVINASYILGSLKFNDIIIKRLFDDDVLKFDELSFELFKPKGDDGDYLNYVKEFDTYEKEIDEDLIVPDGNGNVQDTSDSLLEWGGYYEIYW